MCRHSSPLRPRATQLKSAVMLADACVFIKACASRVARPVCRSQCLTEEKERDSDDIVEARLTLSGAPSEESGCIVAEFGVRPNLPGAA
jgi:hypothetical protein